MSICVRFVAADFTIKEEFLQFHPVVKCTGQLLGEKIIERVSQLGLDIQKCRGQGYDGAAAMSSDRVGTQKVVRDVAPLAVYVHCASHCLNLVVVHSSVVAKKAIDRISAVCTFFGHPLRCSVLKEIIAAKIGQTRGSPLIKMCETRWSQRHVA